MPLYNIHNPTMARRVIYDGSPEQIRITINSGETRYAVDVQPHIAAGFSDGRDGRKDDLWLMPTNPPPPLPPQPVAVPEPAAPVEAAKPAPEGLPSAPPQMPSDYKRYQAPLIEDPIEKAIADEAEEELAPPPRSRRPAKKKVSHSRHAK